MTTVFLQKAFPICFAFFRFYPCLTVFNCNLPFSSQPIILRYIQGPALKILFQLQPAWCFLQFGHSFMLVWKLLGDLDSADKNLCENSWMLWIIVQERVQIQHKTALFSIHFLMFLNSVLLKICFCKWISINRFMEIYVFL